MKSCLKSSSNLYVLALLLMCQPRRLSFYTFSSQESFLLKKQTNKKDFFPVVVTLLPMFFVAANTPEC